MKIATTILFVYLISLFSVIILPRLSISFITCNLILIIALFYLCQKDFIKGFIWAGLGGLFLDFFSLGFPSNFLILVGIALVVALIIDRFFEVSNRYLFLSICFIFTFVYYFILNLINHVGARSFFLPALISAFFALIPGSLIILFSRLFFRKEKDREIYLGDNVN